MCSVECGQQCLPTMQCGDSSVRTVQCGDSSVPTVQCGDSSVPTVKCGDSSVRTLCSMETAVALVFIMEMITVVLLCSMEIAVSLLCSIETPLSLLPPDAPAAITVQYGDSSVYEVWKGEGAIFEEIWTPPKLMPQLLGWRVTRQGVSRVVVQVVGRTAQLRQKKYYSFYGLKLLYYKIINE